MSPIETAIKHFGSQQKLASYLSVAQVTVSEWLTERRPIPEERCTQIEAGTSGVIVCEELRPDLRWSRIPDKSWPWHKKGRPVLEVARAA